MAACSKVNSSNLSVSPLPLLANLEPCIARIKVAIERIKLGIVNSHLSKLDCPITAEFPKDPVVTNCGHLFARAVIERWKGEGEPCPLCRDPLTQLTPIHELREFVEARLPDPVPTFSHFKSLKPELAASYLKLAKMHTNEKEYAEALGAYSKAFLYTSASADYADIPELYERLENREKATLSRLYLSLCQLQEGKIPEAIETLESCRLDTLNVNPFVVGLKLRSCPSLENVEWAMKEATDQDDTDDSIFIYQQILEIAPDRLDAYQQLISLVKDPLEKRELQLKAAEIAQRTGQFDLELMFRKEAEIPLVANVISKKEWAEAQTINLPPYPKELQDFLAGDCTIWPGKKRWQTHIVAPLFPNVAIDGAPIPLTVDSLSQLDKSSGGLGCRFLDQKVGNISAEKEFCYVVMTKAVLPGSIDMYYARQIKLIPPGYEVPGCLDVAMAILWEKRCSGKEYFINTYMRCKEVVSGSFLVVSSAPSGVSLQNTNGDDYEFIGVAALRKFKVLGL